MSCCADIHNHGEQSDRLTGHPRPNTGKPRVRIFGHQQRGQDKRIQTDGSDLHSQPMWRSKVCCVVCWYRQPGFCCGSHSNCHYHTGWDLNFRFTAFMHRSSANFDVTKTTYNSGDCPKPKETERTISNAEHCQTCFRACTTCLI